MQIEQCETCGKHFVAPYGYSIAACWLVTGSAFVPSYMCEATQHVPNPQAPDGPQHTGQHWGCCPEHAVEALMKCLNDPDHMHVDGLMRRHEERHRIHDADGKTVIGHRPRYSDDDARWAKDRGDDFHLMEFK